MDDLDYWRLCDDLSIIQAALLVVELDPSENSYVEELEPHKRPPGYEAAKTAITNGLLRNDIEGVIKYKPEYDMNGNEVGDSNVINLESSLVSVISLRRFLLDRGFSEGFFFPTGFDSRAYLDHQNKFYAPKLAAAVNAWESITSNQGLMNGKTPKQAIDKWLREHANEFGLTNDEGNPITAAIEQISKVANWKPEGGAAKTPTPPQVKENLSPQEKTIDNQGDDVDLDSEIPF